MHSNLDHQVNVVVGLFVVASLATAYFYGYSIIVCVIGFFVIAACLRAFRGGS